MNTTAHARRTRRPGQIALVLLSFVLVTCEDMGCNEEPFDPSSPAAQILESKLSVPVVAGDDYVKDNLTFSWIRINAYDRDGKKTIKAYSEARRITDVDRDTETEDVTLELRFLIMAGDDTIVDTTRSGDFDDGRVMLNELCRGGLAMPDRIVVTKVRVTRSEILPDEPSVPTEATEPTDR